MARESRLSGKAVAVWLALFFLVGLGLRIGLNVGPSFDDDSGRYMYSGNDPFYHDRVVRHITEEGSSLVIDPVINYPNGGFNPNPPVFDWTTAVVAGVLEAAGATDPVGMALNLMVAVWGALIVFPVFVIAASLWNRAAGLWAAFLMAVSAPHIQRGVWGFADHDATTMFWITVAIMALVKGLQSLDHREYVRDWRHRGALLEGVRNSFAHNRLAMLWSAVAGLALSATALTWKGYPYVLAIMAVAMGLQLLWDHVKNKDSTALWAFYLLPMVIVTLLPLPYYMVYEKFLDTTIWAGIYVLIGMVLVGAILVPTRDLPSIVVFPALALAAIGGLLLMLFVFKDVGAVVFTGLGYFEQTKLYTTIAEAQRSDLGRVAASFGFFTFLLAFWGLARSMKAAWRGDNAHMLLVAWAVVAGFMAFAASRFVANAAPVFAVLAGGVIVTIVAWLNLDEVRSRFRRQHGQNVVGAGFRSLNLRTTLGVVLIALFLVLPNAYLGVDAAIPRDYEIEKGWVDGDPRTIDRMGAFGVEFDIKSNGWLEALGWLATQDQDLAFEDRPAAIAWWDYGHWITSLGQHPTVADPFQSHYRQAGSFLAAESEQAAMVHLVNLIVNADWLDDGEYDPALRNVLVAHDERLLGIGPTLRAEEFALVAEIIDLEGDDIFTLYEDVMDASGKRIEYFAVDVRMYPISANDPGIFYAPTFLAGKNPDEFLEYHYQGAGLDLRVEQYGMRDGDSYRLAEPKITTAAGQEYIVIGGTQAYAKGAPITQTSGTPVSFRLQVTDAFYETMYARAFGHDRNGFTPGEGLSHWRVVATGGGSAGFAPVKLLQYFSGVEVSGRVTDDGGQPIEGIEVTFVDGNGAGHGLATTDSDGRYTLMAPFSVDDDLRLVARAGGAEVANSTAYQFTAEQARSGHSVTGADLVVTRGGISGNVYHDANGNATFDAGEGIAGAVVRLAGQNHTVDADGSFSIPNVTPGSHSLTIAAPGYQTGTRTVQVASGQTAQAQIILVPAQSDVTFALSDEDGPLAAGVPFTLTGPSTVPQQSTNATGERSVSLAPGTYDVRVDYEVQQGGQTIHYTADTQVTVEFGGQAQRFEIAVTRTES